MNPLRHLLARRRHTDELAKEIQAHLDEMTDELVGRGLSRPEAAAAARRAFGNVTSVEEASRDVWQWPRLDSLIQDVRFAIRQMRRRPGLSATAIVTLAVGVAANTTVFSWTRSMLLDPLPGVADAGRVVAIEQRAPSGAWTPTSAPDYHDLAREAKEFSALALAVHTGFSIGDPTATELLHGEMVSANFFDLLGVRPAVGQLFAIADQPEAPGTHPVVVLGWNLWNTRFRGDPAVVGTTIHVNRYPLTVVGVAPADFRGSVPGTGTELWVLASMYGQLDPNGAAFLEDRKTRLFRVIGRLAPGVSREQAQGAVQTIAAGLARTFPDTNAGMSAAVLPIWASHFGIHEELRTPLALLTAACGLLLLIVCANLASLLLTLTAGRRKELSLRLALGAPRQRLVRQLLTEAAVLTAAGSALGLLATPWLSGSLRFLVPSFAAPTLLQPRVDGGVLVFTLALGALVILLAGLAPALRGAREQLADALNQVGRGTTAGPQSHRFRGALVTGELALALVTLVGAGLFLKSLGKLREVDSGFEPNGVAMGQVYLAAAGFNAAQGEAFLSGVKARLEREPAVEAVSYVDYLPLSVEGGSWEDLDVEGYSPAPDENMKLYRAAVAPGYFDLLRIPLLEGRDFTAADDSAGAPVMIVNQAFVDHFFDGRPAIGRQVHGWGRWFTIVGVAAQSKISRLSESPTPYFYVPIRQVYRPENPFAFLVRTRGPADAGAEAIVRSVRAVDPSVPVFDRMPLTTFVAAPLAQVGAATSLLGIVAAIAFLLAAVGLYGVIADGVAQRTKEIGIRRAMGASMGDVTVLILRQAGWLVAIGLAVGGVTAIVVTTGLANVLYGVATTDPAVYAAAAGLLILVAALAILIPARRANRVSPLAALREE